jgi:hypothetical protein
VAAQVVASRAVLSYTELVSYMMLVFVTDRTGNVSYIIKSCLNARETRPRVDPSNSSCTATCLHDRYLPIGLHIAM